MELQFHEYANIFPMMPEAELVYIVDDMKANGYDQSMPIILYQGKILDGRNRYRAAGLAGVKPSFVDFDGSEPLAYVIRHNLHRRHLNESQRGVVASRLATMTQADGARLTHEKLDRGDASANLRKHVSQQEAAEMLNVSTRTIQTVKAVEREAPQLIPLIEAGEITANEAIKEIKKEKREADIQQQRNEIEKGVEQLSGKYNVISIDPPWPYGRKYDPDGSRVANPYPEMSIDEIKNIQLPTEKDCVVLLWTTHAFLPHSFDILNHWGATYKATMVWNKMKIGMGAWFRMQCEFCLVGIIGEPFWENKKFPEIIEESRREHSRKPDKFFEIIEQITAGKKLEYFSREKRENWDNYGNEPDKFH